MDERVGSPCNAICYATPATATPKSSNGDFDSAIEDYNSAIKLDPKFNYACERNESNSDANPLGDNEILQSDGVLCNAVQNAKVHPTGFEPVTSVP
ncbi:MAG TPA: tetratricopeptide repeat protein [Pirellulales bacterium]|jgi:hypothetical protein|nr:tetratricopeptide repeat protein [Pirellulales bacterium]